MPLLLKRETFRILEASVENLSLALLGLGLPRRFSTRETVTETAGPIGLIGSAVELAMSACIVQVHGMRGILTDSDKYKSGGQILNEFRRLLREPVPKAAFLTRGVTDPEVHLESLYTHTLKFRTLITCRAGGLHAGHGPSRDVCLTLAKDVIDFLNALADSTRIKPYLQFIPLIPENLKERTLIIEELAQRLESASGNPSEQGKILSAVYLVLPELPSEVPNWLEVFDRVTVAPKNEDICFLLNVLQQASVAELFRVTPSTAPTNETPVPVVVSPGNANALPIAPHLLRREFTRMVDQWDGDVAIANGRLNNDYADLPPADAVIDTFVLKIENTGVLKGRAAITAHEAWPFIASSLSVKGTPGPFWFLVRKSQDLGQLKSLLQRVSLIGVGYMRQRMPDIQLGIQAIIDQRTLNQEISFFKMMQNHFDVSSQKREALTDAIERSIGTDRELESELSDMVESCAQGDIPVGNVLERLVQDESGLLHEVAKKYWARILCEAATEEDDLPGILTVFRSPELGASHTAARKAMQIIDFLHYGPPVG